MGIVRRSYRLLKVVITPTFGIICTRKDQQIWTKHEGCPVLSFGIPYRELPLL